MFNSAPSSICRIKFLIKSAVINVILLKIEFKSKKDSTQNTSFEQKSNYFGAQVVGGAIFETYIDRSHPIAFGYKNNTKLKKTKPNKKRISGFNIIRL